MYTEQACSSLNSLKWKIVTEINNPIATFLILTTQNIAHTNRRTIRSRPAHVQDLTISLSYKTYRNQQSIHITSLILSSQYITEEN